MQERGLEISEAARNATDVAAEEQEQDGHDPEIIDRALEFAGRWLPRLAEDVEAELVIEGLARQRQRIEVLLRAAEKLGRHPVFGVMRLGPVRLVTAANDQQWIGWIRDSASRSIREAGLATLSKVQALVEESQGFTLEEQLIRAVLEQSPDIHWLDPAEGVFWLRDGNPVWEAISDLTEATGMSSLAALHQTANGTLRVPISTATLRWIVGSVSGARWLDESQHWFWLSRSEAGQGRLEAVASKVLAIGRELTLAQLRAAVRRPQRGWPVPPVEVLGEYCHLALQCQREGDRVVAPDDMRPEDVLFGTELALFEVLREHGPRLTRERLLRLCDALSISRMTSHAYLLRSPIVTRHADGTYGLVGAVLDPAAKSFQLRHPTQAGGWTEDGRFWIAHRVTHDMIQTGNFSVPPEASDAVEGQYVVLAEDGTRTGTIRVACLGSGLTPFLHRFGAEPGDWVALLLNLRTRTAVARLGDDELIDQLRTPALQPALRSSISIGNREQ